MTGGNVLINGSRRACLVDFGLSSIKAEFEGTSYWSSTVGGAIRWRALELLPTPKNGYNPILTTACDIYSFGSVMLEVRRAVALVHDICRFSDCSCLQTLSAKMPYYDIRSDLRVLYELFHGIRPRRPSSPMLTNGYWTFITQCWHETPGSRPRIETVTECLHYFRRALEGPYSVGR